ncbi:surfactin synthase thioesterase subunit [Oxalobacteraceae bacterium GrIS 1.11]
MMQDTATVPHQSRFWTQTASKGQLERRLFCFPYAGGGPNSFGKMLPLIDAGTELMLLQLPGHSIERNERSPMDMMQLLDDIAQDTQRYSEVPAVFFGHSLGAIMAFEVARRCEAPWLKGLIVSACIAPSYWPTERGKRMGILNDEDFIDALRDYRGIPADLLNDADLMYFFLPMLRVDFDLIGSYCYQTKDALSIPLTVLAGDSDLTVEQNLLAGWKIQTSGHVTQHILSGHHFFFENHLSYILSLAGDMMEGRSNRMQYSDVMFFEV